MRSMRALRVVSVSTPAAWRALSSVSSAASWRARCSCLSLAMSAGTVPSMACSAHLYRSRRILSIWRCRVVVLRLEGRAGLSGAWGSVTGWPGLRLCSSGRVRRARGFRRPARCVRRPRMEPRTRSPWSVVPSRRSTRRCRRVDLGRRCRAVGIHIVRNTTIRRGSAVVCARGFRPPGWSRGVPGPRGRSAHR